METIRDAPEAAAAAAANSHDSVQFRVLRTYVRTHLHTYVEIRAREFTMIHLVTEKPDPPAQCAAAARDNSANACPRARTFVRN